MGKIYFLLLHHTLFCLLCSLNYATHYLGQSSELSCQHRCATIALKFSVVKLLPSWQLLLIKVINK